MDKRSSLFSKENRLITLIPGAKAINIFVPSISKCSQKARVFAPSKSFQSNLMFMSKTKRGAPFLCSTRVGWPYTQTLDEARKDCEE